MTPHQSLSIATIALGLALTLKLAAQVILICLSSSRAQRRRYAVDRRFPIDIRHADLQPPLPTRE